MKLGEKIALLRRQQGWSQEELAERLDISRQSVSKWESDSSVPELDKIVKLSVLFGITTDELIREEVELPDTSVVSMGAAPGDSCRAAAAYSADDELPRYVTEEEAEDYLDRARRTARLIATGVSLCIVSPTLFLFLGAWADMADASEKTTWFTERFLAKFGAAGEAAPLGGLCVLLLIVAAAVVLFIVSGTQLEKYEFLERQAIEIDVGTKENVTRRKEAFVRTFVIHNAAGVAFCILSVIPLFLLSWDTLLSVIGLDLLLALVAVGAHLLVWAGCIHESFSKLLQEADYTADKKARKNRTGKIVSVFAGFYWCMATAGYLAWSFGTGDWGRTWIVWPVAGAAFGGIVALIGAVAGAPNRGRRSR